LLGQSDPSWNAGVDVTIGPATPRAHASGWLVVSTSSPADETCPVAAVGAGDGEVEQFASLLRLLGWRTVEFGYRAKREPARWPARGSEAGRADAGSPDSDGDVDDAGRHQRG
jgi:hypothetical protein